MCYEENEASSFGLISGILERANSFSDMASRNEKLREELEKKQLMRDEQLFERKWQTPWLNEMQEVIKSMLTYNDYCYPIAKLSKSVSEFFYHSDDIKSKRECKERAECLVLSIHNEATDYFNLCHSQGLCEKILNCIADKSRDDFDKLRHYLRMIPNVPAQVSQQFDFLLPEMYLKANIREDLLEELENKRSYYDIKSFDFYANKIKYSEDDNLGNGEALSFLSKIAGQYFYNFDASDAFMAIQDDLFEKSDVFCNVASAKVKSIIRSKYIKPMLLLLEEIEIAKKNI